MTFHARRARRVGVLGVIAACLVLGGWVANIVKLAHASPLTGFDVFRAIGVPFWPLGVVLGFV